MAARHEEALTLVPYFLREKKRCEVTLRGAERGKPMTMTGILMLDVDPQREPGTRDKGGLSRLRLYTDEGVRVFDMEDVASIRAC